MKIFAGLSLCVGLLLAGCSSGSGDEYAARLRGDVSSPTPLPTVVSFQDAQPAMTEATAVPTVVSTVEPIPVPTALPLPTSAPVIVMDVAMPAAEPACAAGRTVVIALDVADEAAGVVARGAMHPCAYATALATGVMP